MPINVIRLEKGKKERITMTPGLIASDNDSLKISQNGVWILGSPGTDFSDIKKIASDVYVTTEIDDKIKQADAKLVNNVDELKSTIASSLTSVNKSVGSMRASILNDEEFQNAIVIKVIAELERRGKI